MERFVLDSFIIPDFEKFASGIFRFTPRAKKRLAFGEKNGKIRYREPLNQSAAALSRSFAPTDRFENLEIRKGFLRFPNLNLEQNPSLTTLAIESEVP
jgi:hypothetical protein